MGNKFADFEHLLLPEEQLVYSTEVLGGVAKNRAIALTNRRFIMVEDGFRSNYTSIFYSEITDVSAEKRIRRLEIMLRASGIDEPVSFALRDMDSAAEVCEKINMHIRAIRSSAKGQSALQVQEAGYSDEAQLYAVQQREKAYIGFVEARALARMEKAEPISLNLNEQRGRSEIAKAYVGSIGKKGIVVGGRAIVLAGGVGNVTLSFILNGIKKGMPVLIEKAKWSVNGLMTVYSGRQTRKADMVDLGGYRIAARTGAFSYNFSDGSLNGIAAIGGRSKSKALDQNDLKIFSHRRVREGFRSVD